MILGFPSAPMMSGVFVPCLLQTFGRPDLLVSPISLEWVLNPSADRFGLEISKLAVAA